MCSAEYICDIDNEAQQGFLRLELERSIDLLSCCCWLTPPTHNCTTHVLIASLSLSICPHHITKRREAAAELGSLQSVKKIPSSAAVLCADWVTHARATVIVRGEKLKILWLKSEIILLSACVCCRCCSFPKKQQQNDFPPREKMW